MRFANTVATLCSIAATTALAIPTSVLRPTYSFDDILRNLINIQNEWLTLGASVNNLNINNIVGQPTANLNPILNSALSPIYTTLAANLHNAYTKALLQSQGLKTQLNSSESALLIQQLNNTLFTSYSEALARLNDKKPTFDTLSAGNMGSDVTTFLNNLLGPLVNGLLGGLGGLGGIFGGGNGNTNGLTAVNRIQQGLNLTLVDHNALIGSLSRQIDVSQQAPLAQMVPLLASPFQTSVRVYAV